MSQSLALDLFDAYHDNLVTIGQRTPDDRTIPCPLCLNSITRDDVAKSDFPIEHIIPQHATARKKQKTPETRIGTKTTRSGPTITCRTCNHKKGSTLDHQMKNRIGPGAHAR